VLTGVEPQRTRAAVPGEELPFGFVLTGPFRPGSSQELPHLVRFSVFFDDAPVDAAIGITVAVLPSGWHWLP